MQKACCDIPLRREPDGRARSGKDGVTACRPSGKPGAATELSLAAEIEDLPLGSGIGEEASEVLPGGISYEERAVVGGLEAELLRQIGVDRSGRRGAADSLQLRSGIIGVVEDRFDAEFFQEEP